jgi:hypothetical protein
MSTTGTLLAAGEREIVTTEPAPDVALMFERLAKDPNVDVEKLERLIAMQERIMRHNAKAAFDAAFAKMQGEIPVITEKGQILVKGELRSKYATNEDIQEVVRPILQRHGFSLRFRNEVMDAGKVKIVGILSHEQGHSEQDEFVTKPDDSGSKNDIQAIGSARSYGQRYTTTALLNIATRGADDDGHRANVTKPGADTSKAPAGYDEWLGDLEAIADEGMPRFAKMWNDSKDEYRKYLVNTAPKLLASIRTKAAKGKA